jgi:integrase
VGHIEDRWHKEVPGPDGKPIRVRTARYGKGRRYRVRYIAPDGRERSKSFPDRAKKAAEDFLSGVEADISRGVYVDVAAGKTPFDKYAELWLRTHRFDESARGPIKARVRKHIIPYFGKKPIAGIKPSGVSDWDVGLKEKGLEDGTRAVLFAHLSGIFTAAVDDGMRVSNPCSARSVTAPTATQSRIKPWGADTVVAVRAGLRQRYRPTVDVGAGCGLRRGEIFGLIPDDFDFDGGWLDVQRQVKHVSSRLVFGLPKNDKPRRVPVPPKVAESVQKHMAQFPPVDITLPWEDPASGRLVTLPLVFVNAFGNAVKQNVFARTAWHPALRAAGVEVVRVNGMHALRHFYASALIDAGESIKAVSEWLGHADAAFTLRVYAHLMPESPVRARKALDALLHGTGEPDGPATAQQEG